MIKQDKKYFVTHEKHTAYGVWHLDTGVCWTSHNCSVTELSAGGCTPVAESNKVQDGDTITVRRLQAQMVAFLSIGSAEAGGQFGPKIRVMFRCKKPREAISTVCSLCP